MNSVKIVLLVLARDQVAILVLMPGLSLITCSTYSFNSFHLLLFLFNLICTIFGPRFIYCFSYVKVVSNFCCRESKSEFAEIRRNFLDESFKRKS